MTTMDAIEVTVTMMMKTSTDCIVSCAAPLCHINNTQRWWCYQLERYSETMIVSIDQNNNTQPHYVSIPSSA